MSNNFINHIQNVIDQAYGEYGFLAPGVFMFDQTGRLHIKQVDLDKNKHNMFFELGREWAIFAPTVIGLASEVWYASEQSDWTPPRENPDRKSGLVIACMNVLQECESWLCPIEGKQLGTWRSASTAASPLLQNFWRGVVSTLIGD